MALCGTVPARVTIDTGTWVEWASCPDPKFAILSPGAPLIVVLGVDLNKWRLGYTIIPQDGGCVGVGGEGA